MAFYEAEMNKKIQSRIRSTERIEKAAIQLFVKKGYSTTKVDEIASRCKLTKGAIYHYYKGKQDILLSIIDRVESELLKPAVDGTNNGSGSAKDRLLSLFKAHARHAYQNPDDFMLLIVVAIEFSQRTGEVSRKINGIFDRMIETFGEIIRDGCQSGEFKPVIPAESLATVIVGNYIGNVIEWYRSGRDPNVGRAVVNTQRNLVLQSLLGPEGMNEL